MKLMIDKKNSIIARLICFIKTGFSESKGNDVATEDVYIVKLKSDHAYLKAQLSGNINYLVDELYAYFEIVPRNYIKTYISHIAKDHLNNPQAFLYIESELGAPKRQMELMQALHSCGYSVNGKKVLDIGCSNGALLLACASFGAEEMLGIDINSARLDNAKSLVENYNINLSQIDIVQEVLPEKYSSFDVIFATDVVEHVKSSLVLFEKIKNYLSTANHSSFAMISVYNKYHVDNILSEPHYGVPGLVLLKSEDARKLWLGVRSEFKSTLDYEVNDWHTFWEYKDIATACDFDVDPFVAYETINAIDISLESAKIKCSEFSQEFDSRINRLHVHEEYKDMLLEAKARYCEEFINDHKVKQIDYTLKSYIYLKYYCQPINIILKHKNI